ncbi:DUF6230 family protein [Kitasatospora sp. NPDC058046]|uniref:DUF6230 family protein n=1 Tax=Kitasatospora sp. NPDC058046 TaxID=3346312 RepID=UPI0036DA4C95
MTDSVVAAYGHRPRAGRRVRSHTAWGSFALLGTAAAGLSATTVWATVASGVPTTFAVSGSTFRVSGDHLSGTGAAQFASYTTDSDGTRRPVAVAGIKHARITGLCQSAVAHTPLGDVTLTIRSAGTAPVEAVDMVIDLERLEGNLTFGKVQMGRDAATLDVIEGARGERGQYGQQAQTLEVEGLRVSAWSITAGSFSLKNATMSIRLGDQSCP